MGSEDKKNTNIDVETYLRGQVEGDLRDTFPTSVFVVLYELLSVSRTWIALNIVKQPCVGTIELLNEMKE
jgi:hypothetical protein